MAQALALLGLSLFYYPGDWRYNGIIEKIKETKFYVKGSDYKMKYTGRPPKYDNPEDMQKIIVEYFNECAAEGKKPTVSGLGYVLGMSRKQLLEYENCIDNDNLFARFDDGIKLGFRNAIKDAKRFIESCLEDKLINGTTTPIGLIFALKNNYGWVDKQEVVNTNNSIEVKLED